jgi:hypothetical protein
MKMSSVYSRLLRLYPSSFQKQFAEEMLGVFERRARDHRANGRSMAVAFLFAEFSGLVTGAFAMRLENILRIHRTQSSSSGPSEPEELAQGHEELSRQRKVAIQNMCAAIAKHDFAAARRYSNQEARLQRTLTQIERDASQPVSALA